MFNSDPYPWKINLFLSLIKMFDLKKKLKNVIKHNKNLKNVNLKYCTCSLVPLKGAVSRDFLASFFMNRILRKTILACLSGVQMGSIHEKNRGGKSRDTAPLKSHLAK